jgi:hypothetical protein
MNDAIPPITALSFSILGGTFLSAVKFLLLDLPSRYYKYRSELRFATETAEANSAIDADRIGMMQSTIEQQNVVMNFIARVGVNSSVPEGLVGEVLDLIRKASEQIGEIQGMGVAGLNSWSDYRDSVIATDKAQRDVLTMLREPKKEIYIYDYLDALTTAQTAFSRCNQSAKDFIASYKLAALTQRKVLDEIRAGRLELICKAVLSIVVAVAIGFVLVQWVRALPPPHP